MSLEPSVLLRGHPEGRSWEDPLRKASPAYGKGEPSETPDTVHLEGGLWKALLRPLHLCPLGADREGEVFSGSLTGFGAPRRPEGPLRIMPVGPPNDLVKIWSVTDGGLVSLTKTKQTPATIPKPSSRPACWCSEHAAWEGTPGGGLVSSSSGTAASGSWGHPPSPGLWSPSAQGGRHWLRGPGLHFCCGPALCSLPCLLRLLWPLQFS